MILLFIIQLIEKRLTNAQKQLEIIKQQQTQLLRVKEAGSYINQCSQATSQGESLTLTFTTWGIYVKHQSSTPDFTNSGSPPVTLEYLANR